MKTSFFVQRLAQGIGFIYEKCQKISYLFPYMTINVQIVQRIYEIYIKLY